MKTDVRVLAFFSFLFLAPMAIAQESSQFLLTCDGAVLVKSDEKPIKLKVQQIDKTAAATTKESEYDIVVNLSAMTVPPNVADPQAAKEHNLKENLQIIELVAKQGKQSWSIDLHIVPEFDPEFGTLARVKVHGGLVKSSSLKTALRKRASVGLSSLKSTYDFFAGANFEAVSQNFTTLEFYPQKGLMWIGLTCEVM